MQRVQEQTHFSLTRSQSETRGSHSGNKGSELCSLLRLRGEEGGEGGRGGGREGGREGGRDGRGGIMIRERER